MVSGLRLHNVVIKFVFEYLKCVSFTKKICKSKKYEL